MGTPLNVLAAMNDDEDDDDGDDGDGVENVDLSTLPRAFLNLQRLFLYI
jgi:hypothetical protein